MTTGPSLEGYSALVDHHARRMVRVSLGVAEYDDLYQEGMISVWRQLDKGDTPTTTAIKNSMRDWIRAMRRQRGG